MVNYLYRRDKVVVIVQKTWKKMSEQAQQKALGLPFSEPDMQVLQEALA
ncbi:hypothetical protein [Endozoicomonas sp. GU-1]|nr:hypothetical protein [Endozoicomonas sp. GU-1]WBA82830.1 hypothetical protein O2T12_06795 [Endozoicomonas sp. GU-1]